MLINLGLALFSNIINYFFSHSKTGESWKNLLSDRRMGQFSSANFMRIISHAFFHFLNSIKKPLCIWIWCIAFPLCRDSLFSRCSLLLENVANLELSQPGHYFSLHKRFSALELNIKFNKECARNWLFICSLTKIFLRKARDTLLDVFFSKAIWLIFLQRTFFCATKKCRQSPKAYDHADYRCSWVDQNKDASLMLFLKCEIIICKKFI